MKDKNKLIYNQGVAIIVGQIMFLLILADAMVFTNVSLINSVWIASSITSLFGLVYVAIGLIDHQENSQ